MKAMHFGESIIHAIAAVHTPTAILCIMGAPLPPLPCLLSQDGSPEGSAADLLIDYRQLDQTPSAGRAKGCHNV